MSRVTCHLYIQVYMWNCESQNWHDHHVHENKSYAFGENLPAMGSMRLMAIVACIILYYCYKLKNINIKIIQ